jgi:hypothetical protein
MRYLRVLWIHSHPCEPVEIYSEVDDDGYERRKIEVFADGTLGFANSTEATPSTRLGELAVPSVEEINTDSQFRATAIPKEDFEKLWANRFCPIMGG